MVRVERLPEASEEVQVDQGAFDALGSWINSEIEDALSSRYGQERQWQRALVDYEGIPEEPYRDDPVVDMPNIVVTIGAIASDSIFAQVLDLIYSANPVLTARPTKGDPENVADAKVLQTFIDRVTMIESDLRDASEDAILDDVQLGTGVYYIPWVEHVVKHRDTKIISKGPKIVALPVEDLVVPGGSPSNIQKARWVAARFWKTQHELETLAEQLGWDIEGFSPCGARDSIKQVRERLGHTTEDSHSLMDLYEIYDLYCEYDIDGDGICENLYVVWDKTSQRVGYIQYNPFSKRPFEVMVYQRRAHLFYGKGVLEMVRDFQKEVTEIHNWRNLNMMIANARVWKARTGSVSENLKIWPNRIIEMDNPDDLQPEQMGDIYPSSGEAEALTLSLAERRLGVNDLTQPRPSAVLGSRTPGITALSLLQQYSKRFTHTFDNVRIGTARAAQQSIQRYAERVQVGDPEVLGYLREIFVPKDAERLINLLSNPGFERMVPVETTASSASINKEADKQSALQVVQILAQYYERLIQLKMMVANPMMPPELKDVAQKIVAASAEVIDRLLRTFDFVRDPERFVIEVEEGIDAAVGGLDEQGVLGVQGLLELLGGGAAQGVGAVAEGGGEPGEDTGEGGGY